MDPMFFTPKVQSVYERYEMRRQQEATRMQQLGPAVSSSLDEFLLAIGPEVGRFLHAIILAKKPPVILEVGTSFGYSTLFLADAAQQYGGQVITMELQKEKQTYAYERMSEAGLNGVIEFLVGDAVELISAITSSIDFALIDIWKNRYVDAFAALYPKLSDEAVIAADNMIYPESARDEVRKYRAAAAAITDLMTTLLPIGSGVELSVKWPAKSKKL